jgi:hypothetical protein
MKNNGSSEYHKNNNLKVENLYSMSVVMVQNVTVNEYKIMPNVLLMEYLSIN